MGVPEDYLCVIRRGLSTPSKAQGSPLEGLAREVLGAVGNARRWTAPREHRYLSALRTNARRVRLTGTLAPFRRVISPVPEVLLLR